MGKIPVGIGTVNINTFINFGFSIEISYGFAKGSLYIEALPIVDSAFGFGADLDLFIVRIGIYAKGFFVFFFYFLYIKDTDTNQLFIPFFIYFFFYEI